MRSVVSSKKAVAVSNRRELRVGGLAPLTTIDYPGGKLSAVIFCQGCPWRCRYCHNPELQPARSAGVRSWAKVQAFLERRRELLDAVVFSGGEPTLQPGLEEALVRARKLGLEVGLHSAGIYPRRLARLLPRLDWIGLDIKAFPADYPRITRVEGSGNPAWESARLVIESGVPHDMRITIHPALTDRGRARKIAERLYAMGAKRVVEQPCHGLVALDAIAERQSPTRSSPAAV